MLKKVFQKQFLLELFLSASLVAILHLVAIAFSLYWVLKWFDIPMHLLGGAVMAYLALFIFFTSGYIKDTYNLRHNKTLVFLILIMFTSVIGLGWELWQLYTGISSIHLDKIDTVKDLVMNTIGALTIFYITKNKIR